MYDTILVAVDSSEESRAALEHAVALAAAVGATVHRKFQGGCHGA